MVGPLITKLAQMGDTTTSRAATLLAYLVVVIGIRLRAASLTAAHREALELHASLTGPELHIVSLVALRGNII